MMDAYTQILREREQFEAVMAEHVARLSSYAGPYVAALVPEDRDEFLSAALGLAWQNRKTFDPQSASLYQWWEKCLRGAAQTRDRWYVFNMHGRREAVLADRLGRGGR